MSQQKPTVLENDRSYIRRIARNTQISGSVKIGKIKLNESEYRSVNIWILKLLLWNPKDNVHKRDFSLP